MNPPGASRLQIAKVGRATPGAIVVNQNVPVPVAAGKGLPALPSLRLCASVAKIISPTSAARLGQ